MKSGSQKFGAYFLTGGTAAVVDVGGFTLLLAAGTGVATAATASFLLAAIVNFQLSARWVFGSRPSGGRFLVFLAAALVGMAINVAVTVAVSRSFGVPAAFAKVAGIAVALMFNFAMNLLVVFRHPDEDAPVRAK